MVCHPTLAVSESGVVLGILDAWMWARLAKGEPDIRESTRWMEGYQRVAELKAELSGTVAFMLPIEKPTLEKG